VVFADRGGVALVSSPEVDFSRSVPRRSLFGLPMSDETLNQRLIAIDGPAGAGKSSVARRLAEELGYAYVDTGAMYRAVTLSCRRRGVVLEPLDEDAVTACVRQIELAVGRDGVVILQGEPVSEELRDREITRRVSAVSALASVRRAMVDLQRRTVREIVQQGGGVVMDGRDIGSHVFPRARNRFYLDASLDERASRRRAQARNGTEFTLDEWKQRIAERDRQDSERALSPLQVAEGAQVLHTDSLDEGEVIAELLRRIREGVSS